MNFIQTISYVVFEHFKPVYGYSFQEITQISTRIIFKNIWKFKELANLLFCSVALSLQLWGKMQFYSFLVHHILLIISTRVLNVSTIIGGRPAKNLYPFYAQIILGDQNCGGTLVSEDMVLTAVSCVYTWKSQIGGRWAHPNLSLFDWWAPQNRKSNLLWVQCKEFTFEWPILKL